MRSGLALLVALAAVLLIMAGPDLDAPFGPSHDGRNAGMWALASDGVQAHGLVGSKLGAVHADGSVYANHPPITGLVTALSVAAVGRSETGVRLPGLLAALATIPLLWLLLMRLRLAPQVAAVGTVAALATPMFLGFGPMVDTPPMSFPIGLALLSAWLAPRGRPLVLAALAAAAVLAGWESCLLAVVVLVVEVVRSRSTPISRGRAAPLAAGCGAGLTTLAAWLVWVHGSIGPLVDALRFRSGADSAQLTWSDSIQAQAGYLRSGFPILLVGAAAAGCTLAIRRGGRLALVTGMSVGVVAGYALVFRQAAYFHAYWNYWVLLPIAIGAATLVDGLAEASAEGPARTRLAVRHAGTAAAVAMLVLAVGTTPRAEVEAHAGYAASAPLRHRAIPPDQLQMWVRGDIVAPASWVEYYARRPVHVLTSSASVARLARDHPHDLVFVHDRAGFRLTPALRLRQDEARG